MIPTQETHFLNTKPKKSGEKSDKEWDEHLLKIYMEAEEERQELKKQLEERKPSKGSTTTQH